MHRLSVLDGNVHYYVYYYVKLKVKSWTTVSLSTCKTLMESVIVVRGPGKWNMDISFTCYTYTSKIYTVAERRGEASESDISDFRGWDPQHWGGRAGNTCLDILTKELPVVELEAARDLAGLCSLLMICDNSAVHISVIWCHCPRLSLVNVIIARLSLVDGGHLPLFLVLVTRDRALVSAPLIAI